MFWLKEKVGVSWGSITKGRRKRSRDQGVFLLELAGIVMLPQSVFEKCMETLMLSQRPEGVKVI